MKLFDSIKTRKKQKKVRREALRKQEELINKYTQQLDRHGFPMRTRWPD